MTHSINGLSIQFNIVGDRVKLPATESMRIKAIGQTDPMASVSGSTKKAACVSKRLFSVSSIGSDDHLVL